MKELDAAEAERLVNAYSDLILRLSYTYLKSTQDGEDICQTVLLKLLTGDEQFDSPEHEKAWVIRATANACKDELRAFRRRAVPLEDVTEAAAPEPPRWEVLEAVMALEPKYRLAVYLYYYEGLSVAETAAAMRANMSTVQTWLLRARARLRKELSQEDITTIYKALWS